MIACEFCHKKLYYHHTFGVLADDTWYFGNDPKNLNTMFDICKECVNEIFRHMREKIKCANKVDS